MYYARAAAVVFLFVTQATIAGEKSKRPEAPKGFAWQGLEEVNGAVLVPDGWHFSKISTKGTLAYRVTKEKLDDDNDSFLTGLTINVVRDVPGKTKVKPSLYAVKYIRDYIKTAETNGKPKVGKAGTLKRITCYFVKKLPKVSDETRFRIRVTTYANDETGTLYVMNFGTPEEDWEENFKIGKQLFNPILFDARE